MVVMPNIDQHIWNLEFLAVDLVKEFQQHGRIVVSLNEEGPDAEELGLYKLLDYVCNTYDIDKNLIEIRTRNLLEKHGEYSVVVREPLFVNEAQQFANSNNYTIKNFDHIKHFGLFVGRSNWLRLWLSSEMFDKYPQQTLQTFLYSPCDDFHKAHLGFDRLVNELHGQCNYKGIVNLIAAAPVEVESVNQFPILTPAHFNIAKHYDKFLIEIVCETYTVGTSFFPTEKTWRPLICKTPFMIQGPVNFLKNLRKLGFQTFSNYWDENYDTDGQILGTKIILDNINRLSKMSTVELKKMYDDMKPILEHNYSAMMELTPDDFDIFK